MIVKDIRNKYILCCCTLMFFCSTICSKSFRYNGLKYNIISEDKNTIKFGNDLPHNELIKKLSKYNIERILIEEATLEDLFLHYYK